MKKTLDAVAVMREARQKLADQWQDKPREEEIEYLRRKYARLIGTKKGANR
jgi:hypothetical protein